MNKTKAGIVALHNTHILTDVVPLVTVWWIFFYLPLFSSENKSQRANISMM